MSGFDSEDLAAADDLLQVMYWLRGERFATAADIPTLERISGLAPALVGRALETLLRRGLVERAGVNEEPAYRLTDEGTREGGRRFVDEFADFTRPGHGQCADPECDCHTTGSPADCRHHHEHS